MNGEFCCLEMGRGRLLNRDTDINSFLGHVRLLVQGN